MASSEEPSSLTRANTADYTNNITAFLEGEVTESEKSALNSAIHDQKANIEEENRKSNIPASATVRESGVIDSDIHSVWSLIGKVDFCWVSDVNVTKNAGDACIDSEITLDYGGDIVQKVSLRGINSYDHEIVYELISSEPAVSYTAAVYKIKLLQITTTNQTYVCFTTSYSNDADASVIHDQSYKLRDAIAKLQNLLHLEQINKIHNIW